MHVGCCRVPACRVAEMGDRDDRGTVGVGQHSRGVVIAVLNNYRHANVGWHGLPDVDERSDHVRC